MGEVAEVSGARLYSCSLKAAIVAIGNCRMALQISTVGPYSVICY